MSLEPKVGSGPGEVLSADSKVLSLESKVPSPESTAAETPLVVPSILLEDDASALDSIPDLGPRFVVRPTTSAPSTGSRVAQLPEAYGTGKFALTARDPHWLYAHWDIGREEQRQYNAGSIHRHLVVRIHPENSGAHEVHVNPESQHWFIHVERAGTKYTGELGYYKDTQDWVPIAEEATARTPPDTISEDKSIAFATIHPDAPLPSEPGESTTDNRLEASEWALEQIPALAQTFPLIEPPPVESGSGAVAPLLAGEENLVPGSASPILDLLASDQDVGGISSPRGGGQQHGFWFNLNAELIVYGGTEPGASVTLDGVPIKLRPDGTFSCRFALPDGNYELALAAMSERGDLRQATLKFVRRTETSGEVGVRAPAEELGGLRNDE